MNLDDLMRMASTRGDGAAPVRRSYGIEIKADTLDLVKRSVRVIASTDTIDSYDDIVEQDWDFSRFEKNPVVLYAHNRVGFLGMGGDPRWTLPIGYATEYAVVKGRLEATLNFVDEKANPMAESVWQGFVQRSIRAVSVGFYPRTVTSERSDDKEHYRLSDNELWEISAVPLPANPDAVALSAEHQAEREWLRQRAANLPPISRAAEPAKESPMTLTAEQIKQLQDDLTAKTAEIKVLNGQLEAQQKALEAANVAKTEAESKAKSAEAALKAKTDAETDAALDAEVQKLVGKKISAEQKADFVALRKSSPTSYDSIVKGLADLPSTSSAEIEKDVDVLVGKQITPAQKADFIAFRTANPELFAKIAKGLPDLAATTRMTPPEKNPTENKAGRKSGTSKLAENARKAADKARSEAS